jgi:hypothetical protein
MESADLGLQTADSIYMLPETRKNKIFLFKIIGLSERNKCNAAEWSSSKHYQDKPIGGLILLINIYCRNGLIWQTAACIQGLQL